jgi:hypothetical protein
MIGFTHPNDQMMELVLIGKGSTKGEKYEISAGHKGIGQPVCVTLIINGLAACQGISAQFPKGVNLQDRMADTGHFSNILGTFELNPVALAIVKGRGAHIFPAKPFYGPEKTGR